MHAGDKRGAEEQNHLLAGAWALALEYIGMCVYVCVYYYIACAASSVFIEL